MLFTRCGVRISQSDGKWMNLKLYSVRMAVILGTAEDTTIDDMAWRWISMNGEFCTWWGKWSVIENSLSSDGYQIGLAPPERRFWAFSLPTLSLRFVEWSHVTTGISDMTDGAVELANPITLSGAYIDRNGVNPSQAFTSATGEGPGQSNIGSGNFFNDKRLAWSGFTIV